MKKPVIICLDDEKIVLDSLKLELQKAFSTILKVEISESPEEAFELINELIKDGYEIPIIISDWLMPNIKGDEFLIKIHSILPKTKKILLTGQATPEGIGNVVNQAKLYRYIPKPWDSLDLDLTVTEAFKSYYKQIKINNHEKELIELNDNLKLKVIDKTKEIEKQRDQIKLLLDNTLKGFASTLLNIVSISNLEIFEKSIRVKEIVKRLIYNLDIENSWEFEIAALLSHIGCLDIESKIIKKMIQNEKLNSNELAIFLRHPTKTYSLISKIPHFENIALGILNMYNDSKTTKSIFEESKQAIKISKTLRFALDYDKYKNQGLNDLEILKLFRNEPTIYDSLLSGVIESHGLKDFSEFKNRKIVAVQINNLKVGMILSANLKTLDGKVILNSEDEITQTAMTNIIQMKKSFGLEEPIYVYNKIYI